MYDPDMERILATRASSGGNLSGDPMAEAAARRPDATSPMHGPVDWMGLANRALESKLAALDLKFPQGLSNRPYGLTDMLPQGPFPSEGMRFPGSMAVRNPISGMTDLVPQGGGARGMLGAANALVEAKARARADVIRGGEEDSALSRAMAEALGVDPALVGGMPSDAARLVLPAMARRNEEERRRQELVTRRGEQQTAYEGIAPEAAGQIQGIENPSDAASAFDDAYRVFQAKQALQAKQQEEQTQRTAAGRISELYTMDPDQALAQAPRALQGLLEPGKPGWASTMSGLTARAQAAARQRQIDTQRRERAAQTETRTRQQAERERKKRIDVRIRDPLDKVMTASPKYSHRTIGAGTVDERQEDVPDYLNMHASQVSNLKAALQGAEREYPGISDGLTVPEMDELADLSPTEARKKIMSLATELKRRLATTGD